MISHDNDFHRHTIFCNGEKLTRCLMADIVNQRALVMAGSEHAGTQDGNPTPMLDFSCIWITGKITATTNSTEICEAVGCECLENGKTAAYYNIRTEPALT